MPGRLLGNFAGKQETIVKTGSYSERMGLRDQFAVQIQINLGTASFLFSAAESYASTVIQPRVYGETLGFRDGYTGRKNALGSYSELYSFKDTGWFAAVGDAKQTTYSELLSFK